MANILVKVKIMPEGVDVDMDKLADACKAKLKPLEFKVGEKQIEPIAFGLKALILILIGPEKAGGTDPIEKALAEVKGVSQVEVLDVRRAFG